MKSNIAIVTSGYLPVPATLGGAVEALDQYIVEQNEIFAEANITLFSTFDSKSKEISKKFNESNVVFIKPNGLVRLIDRIIYFFARHVFKVKKTSSFRYIVQRVAYIHKVGKLLSKNDFDKVVFENHATLFSALKYRDNITKYSGKYYFHVHNEVTNAYGNEQIIENVHKVLGVSSYINGVIRSRFPNMQDTQFAVLRNAVNYDEFSLNLSEMKNAEVRNRYHIRSSDIVYLFSGRLTAEKGIQETVSAFNELSIKNAKLLIIGSPFFGTDISSEFEENLTSSANSGNNRIVFTGYVPHDKMGELYAIADVCVLPSIWDDPAPLTVIESITAGKPIITTNSGGIPEYVNETNALILTRDSNLVENLSASMDRLGRSPKLRQQMSQASKKIAESLTITNYYQEFIECLKDDNDE